MHNPYQMPKKYEPPKKACPKCKGKGYIGENGEFHTCWDCLREGRLDG